MKGRLVLVVGGVGKISGAVDRFPGMAEVGLVVKAVELEVEWGAE